MYTITSTTLGSRTTEQIYDAAATWAMWGEEGVRVFHEDGKEVPSFVLEAWVESRFCGTALEAELAKEEAPVVLTLDDLEVLGVAYSYP